MASRMAFRVYRDSDLVWWSAMGLPLSVAGWRKWVRPYVIKSSGMLDVNTGFVLLMLRW